MLVLCGMACGQILNPSPAGSGPVYRKGGLAASNPGAGGGCSPTAGHDYTTIFPATETPLSECGSWLEGAAVGLDWTNFNTTPAVAKGTEATNHANLDDSTAIMVGTWGNDQEVWATVIAPTGGTSDTDKEIELRLRSTMTAHSSTGYEAQLTAFQTTTSACASSFVRWNGAVNNFTQIAGGTLTGSQCLHTGDVIRATAIGTTLEYFINGMLRFTNTDATYASGAPGIGSFIQTGSGLVMDFGFSAFGATDTVFHSQQSKSLQTSASGTTVAPAMAANTTTGDVIWCFGYWADQARTATVSDAANGTYTANANGPTNGAGALAAYRAQTFWKLNITGATTPAITMTLSGSAAAVDRALSCHEVRGPVAIDQSTAVKSGSGTAMISNTSSATTQAHDYLTGGCVAGGTYSSPLAAPWTERQSSTFGFNVTADQIVVATGTYQFAATQGTSVAFLCGLDILK